MALIEPTVVPDPDQLGPVHFIAIGGSGMNGVATVFAQRGIEVSGSDRNDSDYLRSLAALGVRTHVGHAAEQLGDARTVVASSAIRDSNPELARARERGLTVLHRSVALASLMSGKRGISIAGTHGKTTTTAMTAHLLTALGADPSYVIGGALHHPSTGSATEDRSDSGTEKGDAAEHPKTGGHLGSGPDFVVEADESDGSFLQYPTEIAVITNVDPDHLVNWGTPDNYRAGFLRFVTTPHPTADGSRVRLLVISADEPGAVQLTEQVRAHGAAGEPIPEIVTFGHDADADIRISDESFADLGSRFTLTDGEHSGPVRLVVPGDYNLWNAAAAYAVATRTGHQPAAVREALSSYPGTYRRFQLVGSNGGVRVFDDYAHHPTEVANTVKAARAAVDDSGSGRLVAVMQPHLYTRTRDFWREFGAALQPADEAVVMDVCGDREDPIDGITGKLVADAVPAGSAHVTYEPDWDATAATVAGIARPGDLVITLGCGDVTKVAPLIVNELGTRSGDPGYGDRGPAGREATGDPTAAR
ncbi:UDP-N-acetylmuramate--L-alanine ligase [Microlunatus soli]|uniref:UDP-N-acetylmuramate--L-alanine ligase n=1 Tax=Microlunatus soli TaxID=630515 RepID=A0A1H1PES2_9ACTN|nr:UDP-N-acetylmuramate--L-alanine ligase [Microlunatus soli]SDS09798.1 UDP-N-acetylmuramate--L-alanine ligase [Microlunatus soli]